MVLCLTDRRGIKESLVLFTDLLYLFMILGMTYLPSVWLSFLIRMCRNNDILPTS